MDKLAKEVGRRAAHTLAKASGNTTKIMSNNTNKRGRNNRDNRDNKRGNDSDKPHSKRQKGNKPAGPDGDLFTPSSNYDFETFSTQFELNLQPPEDFASLTPVSHKRVPKLAENDERLSVPINTHKFMFAGRPISAWLKCKPSDFIVQEVQVNGQVCSLAAPNAFELPEVDKKYLVEAKKDKVDFNDDDVTAFEETDAVGVTEITSIIGEEAGAHFGIWLKELREIIATRARARKQLGELRLQQFAVHSTKAAELGDAYNPHTAPEDPELTRLSALVAEQRELLNKKPEIYVFLEGVAQLPKDKRKALHQAIRAHWGRYIISDTVTGDNPQIRAMFMEAGAKRDPDAIDIRSQQQQSWYPGEDTPYLEFTLEKRDRESLDVIQTLARMIGVNPKNIYFAGTKDRAAVTAQRLCMYRMTAKRLSDTLASYYNKFPTPTPSPGEPGSVLLVDEETPDIMVGDFRYVSQSLALGSLQGNRFNILLKNVGFMTEDRVSSPSTRTNSPTEASSRLLLPAEASALMSELIPSLTHASQRGFLNYFGSQRFGSTVVCGHFIGLELLRRNYKRAAELLMMPYPTERAGVAEAKKILSNLREAAVKAKVEGATERVPDLWSAMRALPQNCPTERNMLLMMSRHGARAYREWFNGMLPTQVQLYLHAYQSYVFNAGVTARMCPEVMGKPAEELLAPVEGDLVILGDVKRRGIVVEQEPVEGAEDTDVESTVIGDVTVVTAEDVTAQRYTLADVVLPIPGSKSQYPTHAVGALMQQMLEDDGVGRDAVPPTQKTPSKEPYALFAAVDNPVLRLKGNYRRLCERPDNMEWTVYVQGMDGEEKTVSSCADGMKVNVGGANTSVHSELDAVLDSVLGSDRLTRNDRVNVNVRAKFTLKSSTYATTLLREILKTSAVLTNRSFNFGDRR